MGESGQFECIESRDLGGVISDEHYFKFQNGDYIYLQGNFLDVPGGIIPSTTHTFMSEMVNEAQRDALIARQRDFHHANKVNVYFANKGDYSGTAVTPWVGNKNRNDKTKMDLERWKQYDDYICRLKDNGMLAEMWFFADDSGFGELSTADKNRLFRYAMARTSAFSNTLYIIALEWGEGWAKQEVTDAGNYIQAYNPWRRLLSVHNITPNRWGQILSIPKHMYWAFSGQSWATFIATQVGNSANSREVNQLAIKMCENENIPHISEEFGILKVNSNSRLRANMWANFCGGAAGGGTGSDLRAFMRFLEQSRAPFQRMHAVNRIVQGGGDTRFCLADEGRHYIVYSQSGAFTLNVKGDNLKGHWFNPRDSNASLGSRFFLSTNQKLFVPPNYVLRDWVLWISDDSNLRSGVLHPTSGATLTQEIIKHIQR